MIVEGWRALQSHLHHFCRVCNLQVEDYVWHEGQTSVPLRLAHIHSRAKMHSIAVNGTRLLACRLTYLEMRDRARCHRWEAYHMSCLVMHEATAGTWPNDQMQLNQLMDLVKGRYMNRLLLQILGFAFQKKNQKKHRLLFEISRIPFDPNVVSYSEAAQCRTSRNRLERPNVVTKAQITSGSFIESSPVEHVCAHGLNVVMGHESRVEFPHST